jgi:WD40 repeat protein
LTTYDDLKKGGDSGEGFTPGKPEESTLIEQISGDKPEMPKDAPPLVKEQVELFRRWVAEGARNDTPASVAAVISPSNPPVYQLPPVISALAYSPDGGTLAVSGYHEILLHNADGSGLMGRLIGISQRIESLAYSPDGTVLAAVAGSPGLFGELQVWDPTNTKLLHSVPVSHDTLYGVSFSPEGQKVAFGCADNSARIINIKDGKQLLRIDHHQEWVLGSCFATKENKLHLITLGRDRALKLTEADTGSFIDDINKLLDALRCLARHPKEDQVACGGDDGIPRLYQIFRTKARVMMDEDLNLIRAFEKQLGPVSCLAFSPDGALLAVGSTLGGEVRLYEVASGQRKATLKGHTGGVYEIAFHPNGQQIATGGHDGQVRIFQVADGNLVKAFVPAPLRSE